MVNTNMKPSLLFPCLFTCLTCMVTCSNQYSSRNIHKKAVAISEKLDSTSLQPFRDWNCVRRGVLTVLHRNNRADSSGYTITLERAGDSTTISIIKPASFWNEFHCTYTFDTSQYWICRFTRVKQGLVHIVAIGNDMTDQTFDIPIPTSQLFPNLNPFQVADSLTTLMDDLHVLGSIYKPASGNCIILWLSYNYPLAYFPGKVTISQKDSALWQEAFTDAKRINKDWILGYRARLN